MKPLPHSPYQGKHVFWVFIWRTRSTARSCYQRKHRLATAVKALSSLATPRLLLLSFSSLFFLAFSCFGFGGSPRTFWYNKRVGEEDAELGTYGKRRFVPTFCTFAVVVCSICLFAVCSLNVTVSTLRLQCVFALSWKGNVQVWFSN